MVLINFQEIAVENFYKKVEVYLVEKKFDEVIVFCELVIKIEDNYFFVYKILGNIW